MATRRRRKNASRDGDTAAHRVSRKKVVRRGGGNVRGSGGSSRGSDLTAADARGAGAASKAARRENGDYSKAERSSPTFPGGISAVIGKRGCGKSCEQRRMGRTFPRVITFDPLSQYKAEPGELVVHDPGELDAVTKPSGKARPFRVLYQPRHGSVIENWREVGVIAYARGNLLLCIDEMGMLTEQSKFKVDNDEGRDPILEDIVHYGRHRKIDVICTAQRPTDVARDYTALCSELRCFQTNENRDLTYLRERMGESATKKVTQLPKFVFLHWTDDGTALYRPQLKG